MNCKGCNATIDYRFETKCHHCDSEIEPTGISPIEKAEPVARKFSWIHGVVNLAYVLASSIVGMISGAAVFFYGAAIFFAVFWRHASTGDPGHDCARGTMIGVMLILSGAFVGTMGGSAFAVKNLVFKRS